MVRITSEVKEFLIQMRRAFRPEHVFLFGSRASGTARRSSDWDFIVVASSFRGLDPYRRSVEVHRLPGTFPMDVLCYTPEEFEARKRRISIVRECIDQGTLVELEA